MIDVVYFSSVSETTLRFVAKVDPEASYRIPLRPSEGHLSVFRPYVLVLPTYGGANAQKAVPRQAVKFLNDPVNRSLIRGVVATGNTNFGETYCLAGSVVSDKCKVPLLHRVELLGTPEDVEFTREKLNDHSGISLELPRLERNAQPVRQ